MSKTVKPKDPKNKQPKSRPHKKPAGVPLPPVFVPADTVTVSTVKTNTIKDLIRRPSRYQAIIADLQRPEVQSGEESTCYDIPVKAGKQPSDYNVRKCLNYRKVPHPPGTRFSFVKSPTVPGRFFISIVPKNGKK